MVKTVNGREDLTRLEDIAGFEHDESEPGPPELPSDAKPETPVQEFPLEEQDDPFANADTTTKTADDTDDETDKDAAAELPVPDLNSESEAATEDSLITPPEAEAFEIENPESLSSPEPSELITEENLQAPSALEFDGEEKIEDDIQQSDEKGPIDLPTPLTAEAEVEQEPEAEPGSESEPETETQFVASELPTRENLSDLKKFAAGLLVGDYSTPGRPPFSIVIKKILSQSDKEDIFRILKEHSLLPHDDENKTREALERGGLLIPQMGEFAAIMLAHQLRRFDIELTVGQAGQIHIAKSYVESDEEKSGPQNERTLRANQQVEQDLSSLPAQLALTTLGHIEGRKVRHNRGPIFLHLNLTAQQWDEFENHGGQVDYFLSEIKSKATALHANAILGVQMMLRPSDLQNGHIHITISGQAVWTE